MINICYVLSTSEKSGGANKSVLELIKHLNREKYKPYALLRRHGSIEEELTSLQVKYEIIPYINAVTTGNPIKDAIKKITSNITIPHIIHFYKQNQIDIVHNNSMPVLAGMEAAYQIGLPYICHIRENVEKGLGSAFLYKKRHFDVAKKATEIIAISEYIKGSYVEYLNNTVVLYDGINTEDYYEEKELFQKELVTISIYGNLDEQKAQLIAVKAMEKLQQNGDMRFRLRIIGNQDTDYGNALKSYIDEHAIKNVELIENISELSILRKFRHEDDINLICSKAEGLGRITIESMLAGCLTIGVNAGATPEIIKNGETGLLFPVDGVEKLSELLRCVLERKDKCRQIARNGQEYALKTFNINNYNMKMEALYRNIYNIICKNGGNNVIN